MAEPERVVWNMGDGQQVTCTGPGTAYDSTRDYFGQHPDCGYVYRRSSAGYPGDVVSVTATINFHVTWSASGAPGGGDLGTVSRTSAPVAVRVNEIQTVVVTRERAYDPHPLRIRPRPVLRSPRTARVWSRPEQA